MKTFWVHLAQSARCSWQAPPAACRLSMPLTWLARKSCSTWCHGGKKSCHSQKLFPFGVSFRIWWENQAEKHGTCTVTRYFLFTEWLSGLSRTGKTAGMRWSIFGQIQFIFWLSQARKFLTGNFEKQVTLDFCQKVDEEIFAVNCKRTVAGRQRRIIYISIMYHMSQFCLQFVTVCINFEQQLAGCVCLLCRSYLVEWRSLRLLKVVVAAWKIRSKGWTGINFEK